MAKKTKVVEATGAGTTVVAATGAATGKRDKVGKSNTIELAMVAAIEQAAREGVTDPAEIKKRMLAARKAAKP